MKVSEQIAIIKAYEDGKSIERRAFFTSEWKSIDNINNYQFNFAEYEYRIKQVPKYRPYESVEEAFNDAEKHGFWIKCKNKESLCTIHDFGVGICGDLYINGYDALKFLNDFVWLDDGSPCGVKI